MNERSFDEEGAEANFQLLADNKLSNHLKDSCENQQPLFARCWLLLSKIIRSLFANNIWNYQEQLRE